MPPGQNALRALCALRQSQRAAATDQTRSRRGGVHSGSSLRRRRTACRWAAAAAAVHLYIVLLSHRGWPCPCSSLPRRPSWLVFRQVWTVVRTSGPGLAARRCRALAFTAERSIWGRRSAEACYCASWRWQVMLMPGQAFDRAQRHGMRCRAAPAAAAHRRRRRSSCSTQAAPRLVPCFPPDQPAACPLPQAARTRGAAGWRLQLASPSLSSQHGAGPR